MRDTLGYAGKRVIVAGAATDIGIATARILVDLGVEVHAVDVRKPDVTGLASFTECDGRDATQVDASVERIGKIVNAFFSCADDPDSARHFADALIPDFLPGSAIASVTPTEISAPEVRVNSVAPGPSVGADDVAWALVFLNSPRAAAISGARLAVG